jgi:hypothetical protein
MMQPPAGASRDVVMSPRCTNYGSRLTDSVVTGGEDVKPGKSATSSREATAKSIREERRPRSEERQRRGHPNTPAARPPQQAIRHALDAGLQLGLSRTTAAAIMAQSLPPARFGYRLRRIATSEVTDLTQYTTTLSPSLVRSVMALSKRHSLAIARPSCSLVVQISSRSPDLQSSGLIKSLGFVGDNGIESSQGVACPAQRSRSSAIGNGYTKDRGHEKNLSHDFVASSLLMSPS